MKSTPTANLFRRSSGWIEMETPRRIGRPASGPAVILQCSRVLCGPGNPAPTMCFLFCFTKMIDMGPLQYGEFISPSSGRIEMETPRRIGRPASGPAVILQCSRVLCGPGNPAPTMCFLFCFTKMIDMGPLQYGEFISPSSGRIEMETPRRIGRPASGPAANQQRGFPARAARSDWITRNSPSPKRTIRASTP